MKFLVTFDGLRHWALAAMTTVAQALTLAVASVVAWICTVRSAEFQTLITQGSARY